MIDMQYSEQACQTAMQSIQGAWGETLGAMGCAVADAPPYCADPEWAVSHLDRFPAVCKCSNFPVTVTNSMECAVLGTGDVSCVYM